MYSHKVLPCTQRLSGNRRPFAATSVARRQRMSLVSLWGAVRIHNRVRFREEYKCRTSSREHTILCLLSAVSASCDCISIVLHLLSLLMSVTKHISLPTAERLAPTLASWAPTTLLRLPPEIKSMVISTHPSGVIEVCLQTLRSWAT